MPVGNTSSDEGIWVIFSPRVELYNSSSMFFGPGFTMGKTNFLRLKARGLTIPEGDINRYL